MTVELDSLAELEPALEADGFFASEDAVARIYVGYRASEVGDAIVRSGQNGQRETLSYRSL